MALHGEQPDLLSLIAEETAPKAYVDRAKISRLMAEAAHRQKRLAEDMAVTDDTDAELSAYDSLGGHGDTRRTTDQSEALRAANQGKGSDEYRVKKKALYHSDDAA